MIPVHLDPAFVRIALIGNGALTLRRLGWLREGGIEPTVWAENPSTDLLEQAGGSLRQCYPTSEDLASFQVIWIADLPESEAAAFAKTARELGRLVNVEDVNEFCDFHTPAVVRRGGLTLSAGTGGASPAAARAARERLAQAFDPAWGEALAEIAVVRRRMKAEGASPQAVSEDAQTRLRARGLL